MEMFQNVDNWLVSGDGGSGSVWWETEQFGLGLDDVLCTDDGLGCYSVTDGLNSPVQSTFWSCTAF